MMQSIDHVSRDKKQLAAKILHAIKYFEQIHHVTVTDILVHSDPNDILETIEVVIKNPFLDEGERA